MVRKKVLIIDDEKDFCLLMQFYLSKKNCDVSISHTLREGLGIIAHEHQDVILLDNNLPDGLGWPAAEGILETCPNAHLFLISANKITVKPVFESNHCQVIEKPITISQIDHVLE